MYSCAVIRVIFLYFVVIFLVVSSSFAAEHAFTNDNISVKVTVQDSATANTPFSVKISFGIDNKKIEVNDLNLNMQMQDMNMGKFDYKPTFNNSTGIYSFDSITLPFCMSGRKEWIGTLKYRYKSIDYTTTFTVNLK